jgi:hypothetical protein
MLRDIGGCLYALLLLFNLFMGPINQFSFYMKAIKHLYLVKSYKNGWYGSQNKQMVSKIVENF